MASRTTAANISKRARGKRYLRRGAILGSAVGFSIIIAEQPAAAALATCANNSYYYGGIYTSNSIFVGGAEGDISVDTIALPYGPTNSHELNYLAASTASSGCYYGGNFGQCQIQTGYGIGTVGSAETSTLKPYIEEEDVNAYDPGFYAFGLTQDDYVSVFFTGTTGAKNGVAIGLYDAYVTPSGSKPVLTGQAWLPTYESAQTFAQSESENWGATSPYYCPEVNETEWYGTNGAGGISSGTVLQLELATNQTWISWAPSNYVNHTSQAQFTLGPVNGLDPPEAFGTYKVGD